MQNNNETNEKAFPCGVCSKRYSRLDTLRAHERDVHGSQSDKRKVKCLTCKKQFSSRQKLRRHEATHNNTREHHCSFCSMSFKRADNLKTHELCHENFQIQCQYENCRKVFKTPLGYKRHQRTHTDEKYVAPENALRCDYCVRRSDHKDQISLVNHQMIVTDQRKNEKGHQCTQCLKVIINCNDFWAHVWNHHTDLVTAARYQGDREKRVTRKDEPHRRRGVACESCGKICSNKQDLDRHKLSRHMSGETMKEVRYGPKCNSSTCSTDIYLRPTDQKHQLVFTRGKIYHQCLICFKLSLHCSNVTSHAFFAHKEADQQVSRAIQCSNCNMLLSSQRTLDNHQQGACSNKILPPDLEHPLRRTKTSASK